LDRKAKRAVLSKWMAAVSVPAHISEFAEEVFPSGAVQKVQLCGRTAMLTYNGPWGLKNPRGEFVDLETMSLEAVVEYCRQDAVLLALWNSFLEHVARILKAADASDYAACAELCTKTFAATRVVRVHFHLFLRSHRRMFLQTADVLKFQDSRPNLAAVIGGVMQSRYAATWNGAFYVSADKIGQLWSHSTKLPFRDYLVQGQWIMNLVQAQKLSVSVAKEYILRSCHNVVRFMRDLESVQQQEQTIAVQAAKMEARLALRCVARPFLSLPPVNEWAEQYDVIAYRYKFLLLEGPSMMAKTAFAEHLVPRHRAFLEVNCAAGTEPDMRGFRYNEHGLILFDEINPAQVAGQRKLFQACNSELQLGCSNTNMFAYSVYAHRVRMVLASNTWSERLKELPAGDQEWLAVNCVHIVVDRPLYDDR